MNVRAHGVVGGAASVPLLLAMPALAQGASGGGVASLGLFRPSEAFTFLFLAMGPIPLIPAFAGLTAGRDRRFKLRLALSGVGIAAVAISLAATMGVSTLDGWGLSLPALTLAGGLLLLLVALRTLFEFYTPRPQTPPQQGAPPPRLVDTAFSPLAFPMILPPYGIGVVILVLAMAQQQGATLEVARLIALILVFDLAALLLADWIMKLTPVKYALQILGVIMSVLQVALGAQAIAYAIRDMHIL
jgi:multiple antibiotic resistance protein